LFKAIMLTVLFCGSLAAQTQHPERRVAGNIITSEHDPKVRIELPASAQYAGADRWVLYDIADCELHAFADLDRQNNVQRLYWVQFEGYVPSRPDLKHAYDSPRHLTIGGMDFFVDTWVRAHDARTEPGSDREHIEALLRAKGYKMPDGMMYVRLVHLLDDQKRKELMVIYGEELPGLSAADLEPGGKAYDRWPALEKGLVERAQMKIAIEPASKP